MMNIKSKNEVLIDIKKFKKVNYDIKISENFVKMSKVLKLFKYLC